MKAPKEKKVLNLKGRQIRFAKDLSTEIWQARKEWQGIFNVINQKNLQPKILYPPWLSFKTEGEIKSFPDKENLKEFMTTKEILRGTFRGEKIKQNKRRPKSTKTRKDQRTPPETPTYQATQ